MPFTHSSISVMRAHPHAIALALTLTLLVLKSRLAHSQSWPLPSYCNHLLPISVSNHTWIRPSRAVAAVCSAINAAGARAGLGMR